MSSFKDKILRTPRTWTDNILLTGLLSVILFYAGVLIATLLGVGYLTRLFTPDTDTQGFMSIYASFLGAWPVYILIFIIFKGNRPILKEFIPEKKSRIFIGLIAGALGGFVLNSISVGGAYLMGDIDLSFSGFDPLPLLGFVIFVFIQSGAEEIMCRCYVYQKLRRRYKSPWVAIIGNSLLFMAMHLGNNGLTAAALAELFLWGVFFALVVFYFDNLWASFALHASWNFTQNIIYGLPNSGIVSQSSIFKLEAASDGFFYDTGFGVEGCWGSVLVLLAVIVVLVVVFRNKERNDLWANWERPSRKKNKPAAETV